jgi:hypothetical protein
MHESGISIRRWILATLAFALASTVVICGVEYYWLHKTPSSSCQSFSWTGAGTGITKDGRIYSLYHCECGDGVRVTFFSQRYDSPMAAALELDRQRKLGGKVLEENSVRDSRANHTGQRIVLRRAWGPIYLAQMVAWTDGPRVNVIYSRSPSHVKAFEAWYVAHDGLLEGKQPD